MSDKKIGDYQLEDHGINTASYWQGAGTAYTKWDECFTGVGSTPAEAADDAVEQAASSGWDTENVEIDITEFPEVAEDESDLHFEDCPHGTMEYAVHDETCMYIESKDMGDCTCDCECDGENPEYFVVFYVQQLQEQVAA
jgi:hypothetical protein